MKRLIIKIFLTGLVLIAIAYIVMQIIVATLDLPDFEQIHQQYSSAFTQVLARDGAPLERVRTDFQKRQVAWQPLSAYSSRLQELVLLSEDKRFFQHTGVDWLALLNTLRGAISGEKLRGASTISMQVVGMIVPELRRQREGRTYQQKIKQMFYAQALELHWTKAQILETYLNIVPLRGEVVGMAAGAQTFFQKYTSALNRQESALLVAMLRSPNAQKQVLIRRTCHLVKLSLQQEKVLTSRQSQKITMPQYQARLCTYLDGFIQNALDHSYQRLLDTPRDAPHLAVQLLKEYQRLSLPLSGSVFSTIDKSLQQFIQQRIQSRLIGLFQEKVSDAAVVVLDNQTGEVLAYIGSSGKLSSAPYVDHANALRQAGSTLKPFLYAQALSQKRLTAASLLNDDILSLNVGSGLYVPQNYDRGFKGWVSMRTALASSLNIPAVKTLTMLNIEKFRDMLVKLGLPLTEAGDYYGYSLALGSADVTLLSLTNAYRALANLGIYSPVRWIPKHVISVNQNHRDDISTIEGNRNKTYTMLYDDTRQREKIRVLDQGSSWIISDILSDRYARVLTFGVDNALNTPFWTAVKTGTSKDMRDNWTIGWSSRYTVGVWVGNSAGESMRNISGVSGAAPIWHDVMVYLHQNTPSNMPEKPANVMVENIVYTPMLEPNRKEYFLEGTQMSHVQLASVIKQDIQSPHFISMPTNNTILAWDPDIPVAHQRLKVEARQINQQLSTGVYWHMNGKKIGDTNPLYWPLQVGRFTLELFSNQGKKLDEIHFQVRGIQKG